MDRAPGDERSDSPTQTLPTARCHDAERIRSVLGIAALIESTDRPIRNLASNESTHIQSSTSTETPSDGPQTPRSQTSGDLGPSIASQSSQKHFLNTGSVHAADGPAKPYRIETAQSSSPSIETAPYPSPIHTSAASESSRSRTETDPLTSPSHPGIHESGASSDAWAAPTYESASTAVIEQGVHQREGRAVQKQDVNDEQPDSDAPGSQASRTPSRLDDRRDSVLTSPLTHPNGLSMFPTLSTTEQDQLAAEALSQAEDSIVADNEAEAVYDSDGGYDSDGFSSGSTSAESCVRDYMYENGRRYHRFREGHYNFPNDDSEQEREDMKHAMVKLLCHQKLSFAPIGEHPQEILDIGTGTGIWAIEMGDRFPSAHVLGIDLSPIQPDWLPPNVRFMVDDVESPWLFPRNHFDYIHSRHTVMAIKDWDRLYRRAFEHLKPGAWIEMQEIHHRPFSVLTGNSSAPPDHPVSRFWALVTEGLGALGVNLDLTFGGSMAAKMREAGFTNVTERIFHVPIGTWPKNKLLKTVGLYWRTILLDGLQAIALGPLTRGLRWNRDEVEVLLMEVRRAYHDNAALMFMSMHFVFGQKPMTAY